MLSNGKTSQQRQRQQQRVSTLHGPTPFDRDGTTFSIIPSAFLGANPLNFGFLPQKNCGVASSTSWRRLEANPVAVKTTLLAFVDSSTQPLQRRQYQPAWPSPTARGLRHVASVRRLLLTHGLNPRGCNFTQSNQSRFGWNCAKSNREYGDRSYSLPDVVRVKVALETGFELPGA